MNTTANMKHYETLSVVPMASLSIIKTVYKSLVLEYHPDKTLGLTEETRAEQTSRFRAVQEAFDVLSDPQLRAEYDLTLHLQAAYPKYPADLAHPFGARFAGPPVPLGYGHRTRVYRTTDELKAGLETDG